MAARIYKNILWILLLSVMLLPLVQRYFPFMEIKKLKGAFTEEISDTLTKTSWFDHSYQEQEEKVMNQKFGFRETMVRINNQLEYKLYHVINVVDVLQGKNDYIFSVSFAKNFTGKKYSSDEQIDSTVIRLKKINEWLISKNKRLLICIAPCKESFVPQYLPDSVQKWFSEKTYYKSYTKRYAENNISVLDYYKYFQKIKDTTRNALFARGAVHWTTYGASLALDTLLKRVRSDINKPVNTISIGVSELTYDPRNDDNDIYDALNLFIEPRKDQFAYPALFLTQADTASYRPKVLLIGDSFYFTLNNTWLPLRTFSQESYFMYYFKKGYPFDNKKPEMDVSNMDLLKEIENTDIIILFGGIGTMDIFPYGFDTALYPKIK